MSNLTIPFLEGIKKTIEVEENLKRRQSSKFLEPVNIITINSESSQSLVGINDFFVDTLEKNLNNIQNSWQVGKHENAVWSVSFSPDSRLIASCSDDFLIKVWNVNDHCEEFKLSGHSDCVSYLVWTRDMKYIISASRDTTIRVWSVSSRSLSKILRGHESIVNCLTLSPTNKKLASGSKDLKIIIWDLESTSNQIINADDFEIIDLAYSPDGKILASSSMMHTIKLLDIEGNEIASLFDFESTANSLTFSPSSHKLASGHENSEIIIWSLSDYSKIITLINNQSAVYCLRFSLDGFFLFSGGKDNIVKLWNIKNMKVESEFKEHSNAVLSIDLSHDMKYIVSGSRDNSVKIRLIPGSGAEKSMFAENRVDQIALSSNEQLAAYIGCSNQLKIISLETMDCETSYDFNGQLNVVAFSSNQKTNYIACSSVLNEIIVLDYAEKKEIFKDKEESTITSIVFSINSDLLFFSKDYIITIVDLKSQAKDYIVGHQEMINSLDVSKDGKFLGSASKDKNFAIWRLSDRSEYFKSDAHKEALISIEFSYDNQHFVTGSISIIIIWSFHPIKEIYRIKLEETIIKCISISKQGNYLAYGTKEGYITIFDMQKKVQDYSFKGHTAPIKSLYIFNKERSVISGSEDNFIKSWNIHYKKPEEIIKNKEMSVNLCKISPDLNYLIASFWETSAIKLWNFNTKEFLSEVNLELNIINSLEFSSDSRYVLSTSQEDKIIKVWKIDDSKLTEDSQLNGHSSEVNSAIFSRNMKYVASCSSDGSIKIWDFLTKSLLVSTKDNLTIFKILLFCKKKDKKLVSSSEDNSITVWNISDKFRKVLSLKASCTIISLTLSTSSTLLAAGLSNGLVQVWDMIEKKEDIKFAGHSREIKSVFFSKDEHFIISGSTDGTIIIWNYSEKRQEYKIEQNSGSIDCIDATLDWRYIISGHDNGDIKIWKIAEDAYKFYETTAEDNTTENTPEITEMQDLFPSCKVIMDEDKRFYLVESSYGFDIFDLDKVLIKSYTILSISNGVLRLNIYLSSASFKISDSLKINPIARDVTNYQSQYNTISNFSGDILAMNSILVRPTSIIDPYYQNIRDFRHCLDCMRKNDFSQIAIKHLNLHFSRNLYTVLHIMSIKGLSDKLQDLLSPSELIPFQADIFGKSPFFYSIMKKHQKTVNILLKYILSINFENSQILKILHSIRNDFFLIIKNSSSELPGFLDKILFETDFEMINKSKNIPQIIRNSFFHPEFAKFEQSKNKKEMPAIIKYTAFPIQGEPYSDEIIQALDAIIYCTNKKIFDNNLIKYFIDFNWNEIAHWARAFSAFLLINIVTFICVLIYGRKNNYAVGIFLISCSILFMWEILQMYALSIKEYFKDQWNWIDLSTFLLIFIWAVLPFIGYETEIEDFFLAIFIMLRGLTSFRIFKGTRYYVRLILESLKSIGFFMVMFLYSTLTFAVLFTIAQKRKFEIKTLWNPSWEMNFGSEFEFKEDQNAYLTYFSVFAATIFNVILMLNMLISILGDSYDNFLIEQNVIDYKTKIDTILEFEKTLKPCKKRFGKAYFFHILTVPLTNEYNEQDWHGKLIYLEKKNETRYEEMKSQMLEIKNLIGTATLSNITHFSKLERRLLELESKLENNIR